MTKPIESPETVQSLTFWQRLQVRMTLLVDILDSDPLTEIYKKSAASEREIQELKSRLFELENTQLTVVRGG